MRLYILAFMAVAASPLAQVFDSMAVISATMGVNDSRICTGEASRGDIGCASNAPYVSRTNGHVGVGMSPVAQLSLGGAGQTALSGTEHPYGVYLYRDTGTGVGYLDVLTAGSYNTNLHLRTYGAGTYNTVLYGAGSGNVGIGTTNPVVRLDVNGQMRAYGGASGSELTLGRATTGDGIGVGANLRLDGTTSTHANAIQNSTGALTFWNYGAGSWLERMRIATNGNVGIGTAAPSYKTEIIGDLKVSGRIITDYAAYGIYRYATTDAHYNGWLHLKTNQTIDDKMNTIEFKGYAYESAQPIDARISYYPYSQNGTIIAAGEAGTHDLNVYKSSDGYVVLAIFTHRYYLGLLLNQYAPNPTGLVPISITATSWTGSSTGAF